MTEQPTEQWVQIFFRVVTVAPAGGGGPASALRMPPSERFPRAASAPAVTPERFRNARRSKPSFRWLAWLPTSVRLLRRPGRPSDFLISKAVSPIGQDNCLRGTSFESP